MPDNIAEMFFTFLDPFNFKYHDDWNGADVDKIKTVCGSADCLHQCHGASHESHCNSCKNGFEHYLRNMQNGVQGESLDEIKSKVQGVCKKCFVPLEE